MKRSAIVLVALLMITFMAMGQVKRGGVKQKTNSAVPDFAYPEKVEATAMKDLGNALNSGDGPKVVNALVRFGLAKSQVSSDSLPVVLTKIERIAVEASDPAVASMLYLLEARIYTAIYGNDAFRINRRPTIAVAVSDDYSTWSKQQFADKLLNLVEQATVNRDTLLSVPLETYADVIDYDRDMLVFYPTLYDFVARRSIECLDAFESNMGILPARLIYAPTDSELYPSFKGSVTGPILGLYRSLVERGGGDSLHSAPSILARRDMIRFISPRQFGAGIELPLFPSGRVENRSVLFEALLNAYKENSQSPYAIELLLGAENEGLNATERRELYDIVEGFIKDNPTYFNINGVKNMETTLSRKSVDLSFPTQGVEDAAIKVIVNSANVDAVTLKLYNVTRLMGNSRDSYCKLPAERPSAVEVAQVKFDGTVPYNATKTVEMKLPSHGFYVVESSFEGQQKAGKSYPVIACSELSAGVFSGVGESKVVAVNAVSGAPVADVSMMFRPWDRTAAPSLLQGTTNADGVLAVTQDGAGTLQPVKGADKYALKVNCYNVREAKNDKTLHGEIFTALGLYRPGSDVQFSVVAYDNENGKNSLAVGRAMTIGLRDVNYQEVDKSQLVTDKWGRAEGHFTLPVNGLTGDFTLVLTADGKQVASKRFTVSDYKLPTFDVKVDDVLRPATVSDSAVVNGLALTFAGFPVGDAEVKLQLSVRSGFWFWATISPVFFETEAITDASGRFSVVIPASVIASSPAPGGYFIASVAVTSADGETHEAQTGFNMGKPLSLIVNVPSVFEVGHSDADVEARGFDGESHQINLNYEIVKVEKPLYGDGETQYLPAKHGDCHSGDISQLIGNLPSGVYTARFVPVDTTLADAAVVPEIIIYNKGDKNCPVNRMLWVSATNVVADENGEVRIAYGTAVTDANVFVVLCNEDGRIVSTGWEHPQRGMSEIKVKIPDADAVARVYMHVVSQMQSEAASVTIQPASSQRKIELFTETFRDKVMPGNIETLRFRVKGTAGVSAESAVMLDMSNKAIDLLAPNPMAFSVWANWMRGLSIDGLYFGSNGTSLYGVTLFLDAANIGEPQWQFYGQSFFPSLNIVREHKQMLSSVRVRGYGTGKSEYADEAEAVVTGSVFNSAMADAGAVEEAADEAPALEEPSVAANKVGDKQNETYRPSEVPLAFFRPMLQTDSDGTLEVTYTVPDANTTWVLQALAYNNTLNTSDARVEIVSSKPLMVSANAPRFLRTADRVRLQASVMNASDSVVAANSECEILDAATMRVLAKTGCTDTIASSGRAVVSIDFTAPTDVQAVVFRVRSKAATFSDGEQLLIPILPSEQDVVESQMFYVAPGQNAFSMPLEEVKNGRAYLKFTENPAWEVVSALPGLRESRINSSLEAAAKIFSAAVADGLMKQYPEIARTLRKWRDNPSDSALVSMLDKNSELKTVLLSSTPWVADAMNQTQRMQRLVLLLDGRNTSKAVEEGVTDLLKTVASDGGWCWTKQYPEVSEWCTMQILDMFGDLNRLGWLPSDSRLAKMITDALNYIDREKVKEFAKYPKGDYILYCYTRSKFPEAKRSTAASRLNNAVVQRIIASWKNDSPVLKGVDAIILNANGYNATARRILESLRQLATVTPERGMWWQQLENMWFSSMGKVGCTAVILDAFAAVDPSNQAIEQIRQWLVLEKTNTDWGDAIATSQVISSILVSGKEWTVNPSGTAIRIGGELLTPGNEEIATGAFTEQITDLLDKPQTLTIDRMANYPSFGAIVTMSRKAMDDIKAVGCDALKVEKSLSVFNGSEWIPSTTFNLGDRVKVAITLKVDADMDYVVIEDQRAAALEPVEQLPMPLWSEGLCFYRENRDAQTNIFVRHMPRGVYVLTYELFATQSGLFASGVAQVQSQYNPAISAHSAGMEMTVK